MLQLDQVLAGAVIPHLDGALEELFGLGKSAEVPKEETVVS